MLIGFGNIIVVNNLETGYKAGNQAGDQPGHQQQAAIWERYVYNAGDAKSFINCI